MMPMIAAVGLAVLMSVPVVESHCLGLALHIDGVPIEGVGVELSVSGREVEPTKCSGGFLVPDGIPEDAEIGVIVTAPDRRLNFGNMPATKLGVASWHVWIDTPPFHPDHWSLEAAVEATGIWALGFKTLAGDGTILLIYERRGEADVFAPKRLGDLLERVDLLKAGQWVVLAKSTEWTLDTPVALAEADCPEVAAGCQEWRRRMRAISTDDVIELAEDVLTERPDADTAVLLEAMKAQYRLERAPASP